MCTRRRPGTAGSEPPKYAIRETAAIVHHRTSRGPAIEFSRGRTQAACAILGNDLARLPAHRCVGVRAARLLRGPSPGGCDFEEPSPRLPYPSALHRPRCRASAGPGRRPRSHVRHARHLQGASRCHRHAVHVPRNAAAAVHDRQRRCCIDDAASHPRTPLGQPAPPDHPTTSPLIRTVPIGLAPGECRKAGGGVFRCKFGYRSSPAPRRRWPPW